MNYDMMNYGHNGNQQQLESKPYYLGQHGWTRGHYAKWSKSDKYHMISFIIVL